MTTKKLVKYCLIFGLFLILFLQFTMLFPAQDLSSKLVSTEWLGANLTKENIRLIDMRADINDYWQAHIPGAVYLDTGSLRWPDRGVPAKLMPPEALVILLGNLGISEHTSIIVYSAKNDYRATYFIWALDFLGHKSSAILENGIERWKTEGRPLTQDYPVIKPTQYPLPSSLRHEVRATLEEVKETIKGGAVILDVRPTDLYSAEKGNWKRKGHIKGAINYYWSLTLNEDGTWKNKEQLKKEYEAIGVTPDKTIIVSCSQGLTASHSYFTLKYILGFPKVKSYDGSFNEWSNFDENNEKLKISRVRSCNIALYLATNLSNIWQNRITVIM